MEQGKTITQCAELLKNKKISSVELTKEYLKRAHYSNKELNAYITICDDAALEMAAAADKKLAEDGAHPLCGVPFGVKDAICTAGIRSTASAKILDNYVPPFDATVVGKIRDLGGVIIGKHNCDAFGHGASNENSHYGPVRNPHDITKVPGGSSGGSAAAVAADLCVYAIGEDTGGSVRQPASFCGLAGLRPSYGRNSRYGIMPMASSLDTVGPIAKTVEDVAILMEVMAGADKLDSTTVPVAVPRYTDFLERGVKGWKVGLPREYFEGALHEDVAARMEEAKKRLIDLGCELVDVSLPHTKYAVPTYYIVVPAEDSSNLGRFDGMRYGVRSSEKSLGDAYEQARAAGFPDECKRRIFIGTYVLSAGYYDAYYKRAQQVRTLIIRDFDEVFKQVDVLLTPTSPFPAFNIGEKSDDPIQMYLADIFLSGSSLAGVPSISVPAGVSATGLPIGAQFIAPRLKEEKVLNIAHQFERVGFV